MDEPTAPRLVPTPTEKLQLLVIQYRKMVAGSHDTNTATKLKVQIYQMALSLIKDAPTRWDKKDLREIARLVLEGMS